MHSLFSRRMKSMACVVKFLTSLHVLNNIKVQLTKIGLFFSYILPVLNKFTNTSPEKHNTQMILNVFLITISTKSLNMISAI